MIEGLGTNPRATSAKSGREMMISNRKHAPIVAISVTTIASSIRYPRCWSTRMSSTSAAVMTIPSVIGIPKSRLSAMAEPMTSARSHAAIAISHMIQWAIEAGRE